MYAIDWEKINTIKKETTNNQVFYLLQVIRELDEDRTRLEREMRELIAVSPSLVNYAREITRELERVISSYLPQENKELLQ